jgi:hypothetical protein
MATFPAPRGTITEFLFAELELGLHELPFHPPFHDDPLERRFQRHALERWERGESSLLND